MSTPTTKFFGRKLGFPSAGAMARRQRDAEHQRDAHGQCHRDLEGADAVGQRQCVVALNEIVGRVVDACTRHQREDAGEQEHGHRGLLQDGEHAGEDGEGNHRQQAGRSGAQPKHDAQLIHEPAHGTHQRTGGQAPAGAGEQDGKAQGAGAGQQELAHQLPDLGIGERNHATTTPVSREYRLSTRPVPMAMLAAMSSASIMRMVPDR